MSSSDTSKRQFVGPEDETRETNAGQAAAETANAEPAEQESIDLSGWVDAEPSEADPRLRDLEAENGDLKDRMLRLAADMENLRRRTEREIKDARQFAVANFARDMLTVADNLDRALAALPAEAREGGDSGLKTLIEGVEMTGRAMLTSMERHGVRKLEPKGQRFDPNFHQAMFEVPDPQTPNNTVVQVVQDGYAIGERVLRPALVGVSKGGPKTAAEPKAEAGEAAEAQ